VCQKDRQFVRLNNGSTRGSVSSQSMQEQNIRDKSYLMRGECENGPSEERLDRSDSGLELQDLWHS
jgi:hypothetical protein